MNHSHDVWHSFLLLFFFNTLVVSLNLLQLQYSLVWPNVHLNPIHWVKIIDPIFGQINPIYLKSRATKQVVFAKQPSIYLFFNAEQVTISAYIEMCLCDRLRERHQDVLRQKLFKLKQEQGVDSEPLFPIIKEEPKSDDT